MLEYLAVQADGCRAVRATGVQSEMELSSSTRSVITWGCSTRRVIRTISCTARRSFTRAATHPKHKPTSPQTRRRRSKALMVNKTVRDASPRAGGRVVRAGAAGVLPVGRWPPSARRSRLARRAGDDLIFARQRRAVAGEPGRRAGWGWRTPAGAADMPLRARKSADQLGSRELVELPLRAEADRRDIGARADRGTPILQS